MDKNLWEAWLEFSSQALKGAEQAREAFDTMASTPFGPDDLTKWMGQWYPKGTACPDDLTEVVETWWDTLGAVPRKRYEELLEHNEALLTQLKASEATIAKLRELLVSGAAHKSREQAEVMLDQWQKTTQDVMEAQADMAQKWSEGMFGPAKGRKK